MAKKLSSDPTLFAVTIALLGIGLVMVWSASSATAQELHGHSYYFLIKQVCCACLGLFLMSVAMRKDYRTLRRPVVVYAAVMASTALLILVLFAPALNDTHRWFRLGPLSFQPAELGKLALILFLAYHLERRGDRVNEFLTSLFPALLLVGWLTFLVYIQPDLGTAATFVMIAGVMLFAAGVRLRYFAALAMPAAFLLYKGIAGAAYRRDRIEAFLNPWSDAQGSGYQLVQSLIAVGTGGLTGVGLMEGQQKLFYLPTPFSDFIFAVLGEELGLVGALAVVLGFTLFLWRGIRAAWQAPDDFGLLLAAGLTASITVQAFINLSVVLGLLPTKGIPLPFISAGGTSLVLTLASVGVILNVSQHGD
jgi:cell division protein FtsW